MPHRSVPPSFPGRHAAPPRRPSRSGRRSTRISLTTGAVAGLLLAVAVLSGSGGQPAAAGGDALSLARSVLSGSAHDRDDDHARRHAVVVMGVDGVHVSRGSRTGGTGAGATATAGRTSGGGSGSGGSVSGGSASGGSSTSASTTGSTSAAAPAAPSSGGPFIAYSPDSFFRKLLPANTPVSPNSAQGVAFAKANDPNQYFKIRGVNGNGWGIAFGMADCSDPVYRISGNLPASQAHLRDVGFHAPASMWRNLPTSSDAPFLVIDRCGTSARPGGLSVWGHHASVSGQTVTVDSAGSFVHNSNGLDRRDPRSNSPLNERSRGIIPDSMAIRVDLLDNAIRNGTGLGHVLEVFWVETNSAAGAVHPMVGAENGKSGWGAEGQRLRIKPGIDLASRPGCSPQTNPVGLAIARTLQQNGGYLGDNSGSGSGIKAEQNAQYPGLTQDSLRGCMTWDDMEFLPPGWDG